mmetsp:Transcript_174921/g.560895  ORF Transcript_174921/g.560895 Transcript_174921/m.560895 type:complete len:1365 (-) Transcript_174921:270-4364(-)
MSDDEVVPEGALILVEIISASGLRDADRGPGQGHSEPYCVLRRVGNPEPLTTTKVRINTGDPLWNHHAVSIDNFGLEDALEFEVRDQDPAGTSDLLGKIRIEARQLLPYGLTEDQNLYLQEAGKDDAALQVKVTVKRIPKALRREARQAARIFDQAEAWAEGAIVEITIKGATGLRKADRSIFGSRQSDPYCICEVPGRGRAITTAVIKNTLDPNWEHTQTVEHVPPEGAALLFEVYDKDIGHKGDFLGRITLDASKFLPDGFDGSIQLEEGGTGYSPRLRLCIKVVHMPMSLEDGGLRGLCMSCCGAPSMAQIEQLKAIPMADRNLSDDARVMVAATRADDYTISHGGNLAALWNVAQDKIFEVAGAVDSVVDEAAVQIEDAAQQVRNKFDHVTHRVEFIANFHKEFALLLDTWMKERIKDYLESVLDTLPVVIKSSLNADPDMIVRVWQAECRVVDSAWPDIRRELMKDLEVTLKLEPRVTKIRTHTKLGPDAFRRYFRYLLFPYNKSFWGKARSPVWVIFWCLALCPASGVSALMFFLMFIIIDKSDEYQVAMFIFFAKAAQFGAHAFLRTLVAYILFLNCVVAPGDELKHRCDVDGPGVIGPFWWVFGGWLVQTLLPWVGFAVLFWTRRHQGVKADTEDSSDSDEEAYIANMMSSYKRHAKSLLFHVYHSEKRHIRRIMFYDCVCVVSLSSIMAWSLSENDWDLERFPVRESFLGCQVGYGWLTLPFFVFCLPGAEKFLIHIRRTAYDELGHCRFFKGAEKLARKEAFDVWDQIADVDSEQMMHQLMAVFSGTEQIADGDSIFHTYRDETLVRPSQCASCKGRLRGKGSTAKVCKFCDDTVCDACAQIMKEPCKRKLDLKLSQDERRQRDQKQNELKRDEEEAAAKAQEEEERKHTRWKFLASMDEYWKLTSGLVKALASAEGTENSKKFSELARVWIKKQSHSYVQSLVERVPQIVKWTLEELDMPPSVKRLKNQAVDSLWSEVREEIMYQLSVALDGKVVTDEDLDREHKAVDCVRARLRHAFMPYNKSIMWQLKNSVWWVLTLLPLVPMSLFVPITFFMIFLFIDKSDEFQLIDFILRFKGTQFITFGIVKNLVGFYGYIGCIGEHKPGSERMHSCATDGPGSTNAVDSFWVQLSGLILQILLTWVCFALLPFSHDHRFQTTGDLDKEFSLQLQEGGEVAIAITDCTRHGGEATVKKGRLDVHQGGLLLKLGVYDVVCAFSCLGILLYSMSKQGWKPTWVVEQVLFALQILYGYLALPFFTFNLPVLKTVLTHSVMTGYDEKGRLRELKGPDPRPEEEMKAQMKELEDLQHQREGRQKKEKDNSEEKTLLEEIKQLCRKHWGEEETAAVPKSGQRLD